MLRGLRHQPLFTLPFVAVLVLAAACGSDDDASSATSIPTSVAQASGSARSSAGTTIDAAPITASDTGEQRDSGGGVPDELAELAATEAFSGDNSDDSIAAAVVSFNDAGLDFSPDGLSSSIPSDCGGIDRDLVSDIIGVGVVVEDADYGLLSAEPGYLSCTLLAEENPDVALAYVHLAPDLNGHDNWASIGTLAGAFDIPDLGDTAVWSDGSRGDNMTNPTMVQIQVDQGGTQSLIQAQNNDSQRAIVGTWSVPNLVLTLAAVDASLTS